MDASSTNPDDLNDLERRLAGWSPAQQGLDADAMLFAAGQASATRSKLGLEWRIASGTLALLAVALGTWASAERSERLALLRDIQSRPSYANLVPPAEETLNSLPATSGQHGYLALRREWEQHPGDWPMKLTPPIGGSIQSNVPPPTILRAWQPNGPQEPL